MFSTLLTVYSEGLVPSQFSHWDLFVERFGTVVAGAGVVIASWLVWTLLAMVLFHRFYRGDPEARGRWALVLSGFLAVACAVYYGLVFSVG